MNGQCNGKRKDRQYHGQRKDRQCNGQGMDRQYNDQRKERQYHGQRKKGKRTNTNLRKHYPENKRWSNKKPTKNYGLTDVLPSGKLFLLH